MKTLLQKGSACLSVMLVGFLGGIRTAPAQANNTIFGPNVYVYSPGSDTATTTALNTTALSGIAQFGTGRIAVYFMPGTYNLKAKVGFYESISGLGANPGGVIINGYLTPNFSGNANANITTTFWRSMENMTINAATNTGQNATVNNTTFNPATNAPVNTLQWGVSQGTSLRRLQINGGLEVNDTGCGEASGGYVADTAVTGSVSTCTQQQWFTRNSSVGSWTPVTTPLLGDPAWNITFSGVQGAPPASWPPSGSAFSCGGLCSSYAYATLPTTPVVREKPFLYVDGGGNYNVFVPTLLTNSTGTSWSGGGQGTGYSLPISSFFIATPTSTLAAINAALAAGQSLILTPGIYSYAGTINVTRANTIVLGMGYADIIPQTGTPAITVADVDGVQIAGLLIDAGPVNSPALLQVGNPGGSPRVSHATNPTSISDVHVRIGGYLAGTATTSFEIDSNNVILDNTWLWRADHGTDASWTGNLAAHGMVVNGDNVTALGLFVEHYQQNQVVWNGNGGETIFYQSEFPYDPPNQAAWMNGSINGYASYYVSPSVTTHSAHGLGVYSNFNNAVVAQNAISVPIAAGVSVNDAVTVFLANKGSITYTVNNAGDQVLAGTVDRYHAITDGDRSYVSFYGVTPLAVTAKNVTITAGSPVPAFSANYSGFVNGDTTAALAGSPAFSTTATSSSAPGLYPIKVTQGTLSAANGFPYAFNFVNGTLTIVSSAPTVILTTTATVTGSASGGYTAHITVTNTGTGPATGVTLSTATLAGVGATSGAPTSLGTIAAGGSATATVTFAGAGTTDGEHTSASYAGTYTGGSFSAGLRVTLP